MTLGKIMAAGAIVLLAAGPSFSRQAADKSQEKTREQEKARKKEEEKQEKKEKTKLFQLDPVVIDVVEYLRDREVPNMAVVKTELFPMTMGVTLDTALERQPGVDVQRIQEVGTAVDDDSIKIRGLGSRRIRVYRNGRLLNTSGVAGGYFVDWTMIPLMSADRVEVVKGVGDSRYGNVLGGAINLIPKKLPSEAAATELQASLASFQTSSLNLFHGYKPGAFEYSLAAGANQSAGYLKNGKVNFGGADLHLGYDFAFKGRLTADIGYSSIRKGFAAANRASKNFDNSLYGKALDPDFVASDGELMYGGMGAYAEPGSWWKKNKWTFDFGYEQAFGGKNFLGLRAWLNHGDREAYNTKAAANRVFHKTFLDDRSQGFSGAFTHYFPGQTVTVGFDFSHLKDDGATNHADDFRPAAREGSYITTKNFDFYVLDEIRLLGDRLTVVPGVRHLSYNGLAGLLGKSEGVPDLKLSGWAPSFKLSYAYAEDGVVYVSAARALRMPTAPEHFWHYDVDSGVDTGDLPFREEDGLMLQAGWRTVLPTRTRIEVAPYLYRINRYIQFDLINFVAYNIDNARIAGFEAEVSQQFGGGWSAFANYTFQSSKTEGDAFVGQFVNPADRGFDEIPGLPAHKANLGVQYRTASGASAAFFSQAVSKQRIVYNNNTLYNTDLRVRTQNGYLRFDLEGRYPLTGTVELGLFVRNLFDAVYQERFGFPAAGRNLGASLKAKF